MQESNENIQEKKTTDPLSQNKRWLWPLLMAILLFCIILYFWKGCGNAGSSYTKEDSAKIMDSMNNEAVNAVLSPDTAKKDSAGKTK